jgi:hypothetical protein
MTATNRSDGKAPKSWGPQPALARPPKRPNREKLTDTERMDAAYWHGVRGVPSSWVGYALGVHRSVVVRHASKLTVPEGYVPTLAEPGPDPTKAFRGFNKERVKKAWDTRKLLETLTGPERDAWLAGREAERAEAEKARQRARCASATPSTWIDDLARGEARALIAERLTAPPTRLSEAAALDIRDAMAKATALEGKGWRAEAAPTETGCGAIVVRDLAVRGMPVIARLRTKEDFDLFLRGYPGHGLKGRVKGPPPGAPVTPFRDRNKEDHSWPPTATMNESRGFLHHDSIDRGGY